MAKKYGKRYGDPREALAARTERDPRTGCLLWTGATTGKSGYGVMKVRGKARTAHSVAYELEYGPLAPGIQVDHRDHCNRLCVEITHLRQATHAQNQWNTKANSNSGSGHRNASWNSGRNCWVVQFRNQKFRYYKQHKDLGLALQDAEAQQQKHYGEFAWKGGKIERSGGV